MTKAKGRVGPDGLLDIKGMLDLENLPFDSVVGGVRRVDGLLFLQKAMGLRLPDLQEVTEFLYASQSDSVSMPALVACQGIHCTNTRHLDLPSLRTLESTPKRDGITRATFTPATWVAMDRVEASMWTDHREKDRETR
jgi:hypothetical protein